MGNWNFNDVILNNVLKTETPNNFILNHKDFGHQNLTSLKKKQKENFHEQNQINW